MKPILTVEFHAKATDYEYEEESVPLHSPDELFKFVAPGGGCESIPDEVEEIKWCFFHLHILIHRTQLRMQMQCSSFTWCFSLARYQKSLKWRKCF